MGNLSIPFNRLKRIFKPGFFLLSLFFSCTNISAQTETDADMMAKNLLCVGPMYTYSSWNQYWEGTRKRDNRNLGTVSTQTFSFMGNYGLSKKINLLFSIPYVKTHATGGTLHDMKGIQDLSVFIKWKPVTVREGKNRFSALGFAGYSAPMSDYPADFLPLSIGLRSQTVTGRVMADYQRGSVFITGSAAYMMRANISIDRNAYYTTQMHLTNKVEMPDQLNYNLRLGFRNKYIVAEAVLSQTTTIGGFDITRNNMQFPGNKMNMTMGGANVRYIPKNFPDLNFNAGAVYTVAGRNVGQSTMFYGGAFYIFHFTRKATVFEFQN